MTAAAEGLLRTRAGADLLRRIATLPPGRRLIAVAGPPGAGKSTLAAAVAASIGAALVPMDGFHLDDSVLAARGLRAVQGAPQTFDAAGFAALVERLRTGDEVIHPVFDRTREIAIAGAGVVPASAGPVVVEGNYLLLDASGWDGLRWDLSVFLDEPETVVTERLTRRWQALGCDAAGVAAHLANDLANARLVLSRSRPADITLRA